MITKNHNESLNLKDALEDLIRLFNHEDLKVERSNSTILHVYSWRGKKNVVYKGGPSDMIHLLQLTKEVVYDGRGMNHVSRHKALEGSLASNELKKFLVSGSKAELVLCCMGGMSFDTAFNSSPLNDLGPQDVCMSYALYVEDPSVSMLELLQW